MNLYHASVTRSLRPLPQVYADVLFTDVTTATFWSTLPMSLDSFCSHMERRANECREAMQEFWLSDAAGLVGQYVGPLIQAIQAMKGKGGGMGGTRGAGGWDDTGRHLDGAAVQLRPGFREEPGGDTQGGDGLGGVDDIDADEEFHQWFEQSPAAPSGEGAGERRTRGYSAASERGGSGDDKEETQTLMERRMELEAGLAGSGDAGRGVGEGSVGLRGGGGGGAGSRHRPGGRTGRALDPFARLTGILESVSMLMSRHLRGTVERSLGTFVHLFERVSHPHHSGDATFVLMLHVNEDAFDDIEGRSQARQKYRKIFRTSLCFANFIRRFENAGVCDIAEENVPLCCNL